MARAEFSQPPDQDQDPDHDQDQVQDQAHDLAQEDAQHRRALALLIDLASQYARDLGAPDIHPLDRADSFERIGRVVHRSIRIAHLLREPAPNLAAAPQTAPERDPAADLACQRTAARTRILREVEDTIERDAPTRLPALRAELLERLDDPGLDDDLARRPVAELIAELIRDLGLASRCGGPPAAAALRPTSPTSTPSPPRPRAKPAPATPPTPLPIPNLCPDPARSPTNRRYWPQPLPNRPAIKRPILNQSVPAATSPARSAPTPSWPPFSAVPMGDPAA